ncbi:MAG: DNA-protecting protein DprA [Chitinophagaceae bacterium]|nr:DNA-protecting protein DprA [Chitinophagaceae bacterium]
MNDDLPYQIALTLVPQVGAVHAKTLVTHFGEARKIFNAKKKDLERIEGIGSVRAKHIREFRQFDLAEDEVRFLEKYRITPLFITDANYPQRLLNCYDSPPLLYFRGNVNLNHSRIISVVGTRNNSGYGKSVCEKLIEELKAEDVLIVSGLAFGIDTIAHRAALKNNLPTLGVLGHGLDRIYPAQNKHLAREMTVMGGLLTEFTSQSKPDKQNFPRRNRIVAGICDALVVIESSKQGGSMITAELGNSYNRDVFAIPGRTTDAQSEGCHYLVRNNKAALICDARDLLDNMGWTVVKKPVIQKQRELFVELSPDEKLLVNLLESGDGLPIDEIYLRSGLSSSSVAAALLMLEMQGIVLSLPGKVFKLA